MVIGVEKMIHYHGTPITPLIALDSMVGQHFCVSYFRPDSLRKCLQIGQSIMFDNGAFSCKTRGGVPFDLDGFYEWVDPLLGHPHWAVVPDVIDGSVDEQRKMVKTWPFPKSLGIPVWHLGLPLGYLLELVDQWGKVCFGSAGEYWQVGSVKWVARMNEALNLLDRTYNKLPWIHGLRMLGQTEFPLASADSTNVALHHAEQMQCAGCMAKRINANNPVSKWTRRLEQGVLFG